jgi:hypothetical protein
VKVEQETAATATVKAKEVAAVKAEEEAAAVNELDVDTSDTTKSTFHQTQSPTSSDWEWMKNGRLSTTGSICPRFRGKKEVEPEPEA